MINISWTIF